MDLYLEIPQADSHPDDQHVPPGNLLKQHNLCRSRGRNFLFKHWEIERLRKTSLDVLGDVANELLACDTACTATSAWLKVDQVTPDLLGGVGVVRDICVWMQAKDFGCLDQRKRFNGIHIDRAMPFDWNDVIDLLIHKEMEGLEGVKEEISQVLLQVSIENTPIECITDASAIHSLADQVA